MRFRLKFCQRKQNSKTYAKMGLSTEFQIELFSWFQTSTIDFHSEIEVKLIGKKPVLNVYQGNRLKTQNFLSCPMFLVIFWLPNLMIWQKDGILVSIRIIFLACKLKTSKMGFKTDQKVIFVFASLVLSPWGYKIFMQSHYSGRAGVFMKVKGTWKMYESYYLIDSSFKKIPLCTDQYVEYFVTYVHTRISCWVEPKIPKQNLNYSPRHGNHSRYKVFIHDHCIRLSFDASSKIMSDWLSQWLGSTDELLPISDLCSYSTHLVSFQLSNKQIAL